MSGTGTGPGTGTIRCMATGCKWLCSYPLNMASKVDVLDRYGKHVEMSHPPIKTSPTMSVQTCTQSPDCMYDEGVWYRSELQNGRWSRWNGSCFRHFDNELDRQLSQSTTVQVTYSRQRALMPG